MSALPARYDQFDDVAKSFALGVRRLLFQDLGGYIQPTATPLPLPDFCLKKMRLNCLPTISECKHSFFNLTRGHSSVVIIDIVHSCYS